ncbi:RluA family pseudouridine synthase [Buchnera aphidicola (Ceratovacuna keduensis)]|uniref:RluA family pseudouridine synthase n=1 Tax=Buchnera aphidicola TaxID=9 RepID=UPI0031B866AF
MNYKIGTKNVFLINFKKKCRIDIILQKKNPKYSRSKIKRFFINGRVFLNGIICKKPSKRINYSIVMFIEKSYKKKIFLPENIYLNFIYIDKYIAIINKKDNIVMHPGNGNKSGTILNAILHYFKESKNIPRAGIVHRLDKDTTGLLVLAKNLFSYNKLLKLIKKREIIREYEAIVLGNIFCNGYISAPIKRHKFFKTKMCVNKYGKKAVTYYKVINRFSNCTHLRIKLKTGRTHQIRVHFLHINHPIIGDKKYFDNRNIHFLKKDCFNYIKKFPRQALHSIMIKFKHPKKKKVLKFCSDLPKDIKKLIKVLKNKF